MPKPAKFLQTTGLKALFQTESESGHVIDYRKYREIVIAPPSRARSDTGIAATKVEGASAQNIKMLRIVSANRLTW